MSKRTIWIISDVDRREWTVIVDLGCLMKFGKWVTAMRRLTSVSHLLTATLALVFVCAGTEARSAQIEVLPTNSGSLSVISVTGDLVLGDEIAFVKVALPIEKAVVVLNSHGGNLVAGIEIGKAIRLKEYSTIVSKSGVCASSCALAWLGGIQRFMEPGAQVGFHVAYIQDQDGIKETGQGNALAGAYLNQLGLPQSAVLYVTAAAPQEMNWLSADEAKKIGIEVTVLATVDTNTTSNNTAQVLASLPDSTAQFNEATAAYKRGDYATTLQIIRPLAAQGLADAQYNLGGMYVKGEGVPQDYAEAARWFRCAADQGIAE